MSKDELLSIIEKELKDNQGATNIEIAMKLNIPVNSVQLFRRMISIGEKEENPAPEREANNTDESL